jgi:hypothetical protein
MSLDCQHGGPHPGFTCLRSVLGATEPGLLTILVNLGAQRKEQRRRILS